MRHTSVRTTGRERGFYVDFIVRLKDGTICLYDTKTQGSDIEAPAKHNALIEYIKAEMSKGGPKMKGGVVIKDGETWKCCPLQISNTNSLVGWETVDFK